MTTAPVPRDVAAGYRAARPVAPPAGRGAAVGTVAESNRATRVGAALGFAALSVFGLLRGDHAGGAGGGLVLAAIFAGGAWRSRLSAGGDWLDDTALLGRQWVDLTALRSVSLRRAVNGGTKVGLTDTADREVEVRLDLLRADPRVRAVVRDGLHASRTNTTLAPRDVPELLAQLG